MNDKKMKQKNGLGSKKLITKMERREKKSLEGCTFYFAGFDQISNVVPTSILLQAC